MRLQTQQAGNPYEFAVKLLIIIAFLWGIVSSGRDLWNKFIDPKGDSSLPTIAYGNFPEGSILELGTDINYCAEFGKTSNPTYPCNFDSAWKGTVQQLQLFRGDVVQIIGPPAAFVDDYVGRFRDQKQQNQKKWFWPVKVVQAGIYTEGSIGWVPDSGGYITYLNKLEALPTRPLPDVVPGQIIKTRYMFAIRDEPAGTGLDDINRVVWGYRARLLEVPLLANDGHFWCRVKADRSEGWIPCEFED